MAILCIWTQLVGCMFSVASFQAAQSEPHACKIRPHTFYDVTCHTSLPDLAVR